MILSRRYIAAMLFYIVVSSTNALFADESRLFSIHYDTSAGPGKIALIIPGKNQGQLTPGYHLIGEYYKKKGIRPVYIDIRWRALGIVGINKLSIVAQQISSMVRDSFPHSHIFLFGFSFGAAISLKVAQQLAAEHILLCSMSPIFFEDWKRLTFPRKQLIGMFSDFSKNGLSYSAGIDNCVSFLYGDHENTIITRDIIKHRRSVFRCNETIIVKDARHDISGQTYQKAIETMLTRIPHDTAVQ